MVKSSKSGHWENHRKWEVCFLILSPHSRMKRQGCWVF
ncbi:hypothetical protein B932_3394 [Gluconobacter oxydans H24]|nr:hypothetical protein B932_0791 [Gluconobacter oxydans H24]AFW00544.1 hypothetical protein B932_0952 [Gluconobacter oxydans H24]AFW01297.1 hypothetical protein B932_1725 [Gluconobacter oxydans H24]AFW01737.1 hypothetical protein B932_2173 [Gluconobacter oxydans H24]AFW02936.1 hypothetical protein B932_3394 [Gluconobacter oxydans H24]